MGLRLGLRHAGDGDACLPRRQGIAGRRSVLEPARAYSLASQKQSNARPVQGTWGATVHRG